MSNGLTLTVRAAPDAQGVVAHSVAHVSTGVTADCVSDMRLVSADDSGVLLQDVPSNSPGPTYLGFQICATGGQIHVTLNPDNTLRTEVIAAGAGHPTGTLHHTG
jgi:hypothetical protein